MRAKIIASVVALMVLVQSIAAQNTYADVQLELQRIILNDTEISLDDTPGFLVTILDGEDVYHVPFGSRAKQSSDSLTAQDIFELGSISKVFTASLTNILASKGLISLSDKVNSYLPQQWQNPRLDEITIEDLIVHTTGLPIKPHFFGKKNTDASNPYKYYSKEDLLQFYANYVPRSDETGAFRYAHTNYALLEVVLEYATETEYPLLLRTHLLDELQMESTFVEYGETRDSIVTPGYDRAGREADPWLFQSFAGSEGVKSTAQDLLQLVRGAMGTAGTTIDEVLIDNTKPLLPTNFNDYIHTAKGWQVIKRKKKYNIVTHTGKSGGHNAAISFIPETETAVIVLANSSIGTENLSLLVLRMINRNWKRKTP